MDRELEDEAGAAGRACGRGAVVAGGGEVAKAPGMAVAPVGGGDPVVPGVAEGLRKGGRRCADASGTGEGGGERCGIAARSGSEDETDLRRDGWRGSRLLRGLRHG